MYISKHDLYTSKFRLKILRAVGFCAWNMVIENPPSELLMLKSSQYNIFQIDLMGLFNAGIINDLYLQRLLTWKKNDFANLVLWVIVYKVFIGIPCNQKVKYNFWNCHSLH